MRDEWYVARQGQTGNKRYGPVPLNQLRELMGAGRVRGNDLVWREGMAAWERADQCSALDAQPPAPAAPPDYRGDGYGQERGPRGYAPAYDGRPYRRPYPQQSSSTWVIPVVIVGGALLFGALIFGGIMCFAFVASSSSSGSSSYSTPSYYRKATPPLDEQPVVPDPGAPFGNPPPDQFVPKEDPPPFVPDVNPPPDDNPGVDGIGQRGAPGDK